MNLEEFKKKLSLKKEKLIVVMQDPISSKKMSYIVSNDMTLYRARTLFTKEPFTIDWLRSFKKDSIFYDIGANVGMYSIFAACISKANVYSFEPEANNFQVLVENVVANKLMNKVNSFPIGISNSSSLTTLYLSSFKTGGSHHMVGESLDRDLNKKESEYKQGIFSTSLEDLVKIWKLPIPNYIKIDVDGIEYKIIEKSDFLLKNVDLRSILIEMNSKTDVGKYIISKLKSFDFVYDKKQVDAILEKKEHGYAEYIFYRK